MPDDNGRKAAKAIALILVCAWTLITVSLSLEGVDAVTPPHYGLFSAVVFLLVGKLWDLEVKSALPGGSEN